MKKPTLVSDLPVTFLLQYWSLEASNFRYLFFDLLIFYPYFKRIDITVMPTLLPEHKKTLHPLSH